VEAFTAQTVNACYFITHICIWEWVKRPLTLFSFYDWSRQQAPPPYPRQGQPAFQQPSTPLFVDPPTKPRRLLHSEAYLKYIEGLNAESSTISKWDQTLSGEHSSLKESDLHPNKFTNHLYNISVIDVSVNYLLEQQKKHIQTVV
jgi:hypothetical protein